VTRDIDGPATLTASVTGGNYGEYDLKLAFSTPVVQDHVYFGISLGDLQRGGYGEVVAQPGQAPSPYNSIGEAVLNKDILGRTRQPDGRLGESSKLKFIADDILDNSNASGASGSITTCSRSSATSTCTPTCRSTGLLPSQRLFGNVYAKPDQGARSEGRRRLLRGRGQQFIISRKRTRTSSRCPASITTSRPRARRS